MAEIMNLIAASKRGKSWLVLYLILCIAIGRMFFDRFQVQQGKVLLIDNELHPETLASRLKMVASAMGITTDQYVQAVDVEPLRGRLQDLYALGRYLDQIEPGKYRLIVLDAFYRFLPAGTDENDNGAMANLYNVLDSHAQRLECAFVLIHHASKGSQADKSVTDVGAGAGSMARATDTHLILRPHEEEGVVVLDGATRSWPPMQPLCLRWNFPLWQPDDRLDPSRLQRPGKKRDAKAEPAEPELTPVVFIAKYLKPVPQDRMAVIARAGLDGISARKAESLLRLAVADGLAHEWRGATRFEPVRFSTEPNPVVDSSRSCARTPHTPRGCEDAPRGRGKAARVNKRGAA